MRVRQIRACIKSSMSVVHKKHVAIVVVHMEINSIALSSKIEIEIDVNVSRFLSLSLSCFCPNSVTVYMVPLRLIKFYNF